MSKNFYEEGFPDDDPTDELPVLTDVFVDGDRDDDDETEVSPTLAANEDTGTFERTEIHRIPTLEDRDETATELARTIADRDAKLATLEAELAKLDLRWRRTSDDLAARNSELATVRATLRHREGEWQSERDAAARARSDIEDREREIAALKAELETARASAAALEDNARALEQQIVELEALHAQRQNEPPSKAESATADRLREELAALAAHIENRNGIWRRQAAEVAEKTTRIRELELEVAQRMAAQQDAERLAGLEASRARDYREQLVAATAALDATQVRAALSEAQATPAAPAPAAAGAPTETQAMPHGDPLAAQLARAVALQQSLGDDSEGLRRLEELELAIRDLEQHMDGSIVAEPVPTAATIPPQLICLTGDELEPQPLDDGDILIGRGSHCAIRVMTHYVSREHARVANVGGQYILEDLGSRNGVFVNSVRVERHALENDDLITIGDTQFRFRAASHAHA